MRSGSFIGCTAEKHAAIKASAFMFALMTERLPHHDHAEAYQPLESIGSNELGELWYRNCRACQSTLCMHVIDVQDVAKREAA